MHIHSVGAFEAKTKLPALLRAVEKGEEYIITHRGKAIAKLSPMVRSSKRPVSEVIDEILHFRPSVDCSSFSTEKMRQQGRR